MKEQNALLHEMNQLVKDVRIGNHVSIIECQKGIIRSNESLQNLIQYLKVKYPAYKLTYLLTTRLNQDILENFVSYIRSMRAAHDYPSDLDIRQRIKFILGKHFSVPFCSGTNTVGVATEEKLLNITDASSENFEDSMDRGSAEETLINLSCSSEDLDESLVESEGETCQLDPQLHEQDDPLTDKEKELIGLSLQNDFGINEI